MKIQTDKHPYINGWNSEVVGYEQDSPSLQIPFQNDTYILAIENARKIEGDDETVVVIGSGDFGLSLIALLLRRSYKVILASRNPEKTRKRFNLPDLPIAGYQSALQSHDLVIVAIPCEGFPSLPAPLLAGKVVIDVSNRPPLNYKDAGPSLAEQLQQKLPGSKVVKAFNTLSAYSLQNNLFQGSEEIPICSDDEEAKTRVMALVRNLGFCPVNRGNLANAKEIENIPFAFFPNWRIATVLALSIFVFAFTIMCFWSDLCDNLTRAEGEPWNWEHYKKFMLSNFSNPFAYTAITLLASCYLPGVFASYLQLYRGTKYSEFPEWLARWLKSRKQIGLYALLFASMHGCMAIVNDTAPEGDSTETWDWREYTYHGLGVLALATMVILGISSIPSVSGSLSWREFSFLQRYIGWLCLTLAALHLIFGKWSKLITVSFECYFIPQPSQIFILLPLLTIILKIPLLLPCVRNQLLKIRRGYERLNPKTEVYPESQDL